MGLPKQRNEENNEPYKQYQFKIDIDKDDPQRIAEEMVGALSTTF